MGGQKLVRVALGALAASGVLVLTGCDKVTGGGTMPSVMPGQKAHFSFSGKCRTETVGGTPTAFFYDGHFNFRDTAVDVEIDGVMTRDVMIGGATCREFHEAWEETGGIPSAEFHGTYRDKHGANRNQTGLFVVTVTDNGEPGRLDTISVDLFPDDLSMPYMNSGPATTGNIQIH